MSSRLRIRDETKEQADRRLEREIRKYLAVQTTRRKQKQPYIVKFYRGWRSVRLLCRIDLKPHYLVHTNREAYSLEMREDIYRWLENNGFTYMIVQSLRGGHYASFYQYRETKRVRDPRYQGDVLVDTGNLLWNCYFSNV